MRHYRLLRFARAWSLLSGSLLVLVFPACGSSGSSSTGLGGSGGSGTGGSSTGGTGGSSTGGSVGTGGSSTGGRVGTGGSSTGGSGGSSTGGRGGTGGGAGSGAGGRGGTGATGTGGSAGGSGSGGSGGIGATPPVSPYIVVDQFGYLPDGEKVAVIRDPQTGFDASATFTPGSSYALVNAANGSKVYTAAPTVWNGGATDTS